MTLRRLTIGLTPGAYALTRDRASGAGKSLAAVIRGVLSDVLEDPESAAALKVLERDGARAAAIATIRRAETDTLRAEVEAEELEARRKRAKGKRPGRCSVHVWETPRLDYEAPENSSRSLRCTDCGYRIDVVGKDPETGDRRSLPDAFITNMRRSRIRVLGNPDDADAHAAATAEADLWAEAVRIARDHGEATWLPPETAPAGSAK